jgi:small-conductance mechanosensitive channel
MAQAIEQWLSEMGWTTPVAQMTIAATLVTLAAIAGHLAAHWGADSMREWARVRFGSRAERTLGERLPDLLRYWIGALILFFPLTLLPFDTPAQVIIAIGFAGAVVLLVAHALRLAGVPMWTCMVLAGTLATVISVAAIGGLKPMSAGLDATAINVGARRISLLSLVSFLVVSTILFTLTHIANYILTQMVSGMSALDASQRVLVQKIGGLAILVTAVLFGLDVLGIDLTNLTVFSGALGLAVGFGLQKTFGNLIAGLILLMDKSVKPGDVIAVGDKFGAINKIGVRAVSVITRDGKEHLIPNELLMTQAVENWSYSSRDVRIHIPVTVSYGSDLKLAQKLMIEAAKASRRVLPQPEPTVWLLKYGENGLEHDVMVWIIDPEQGVGNVQSDVLNRLWVLFRENGIGLPYAQQDVYVHTAPDHAGGAANLRMASGKPPDENAPTDEGKEV